MNAFANTPGVKQKTEPREVAGGNAYARINKDTPSASLTNCACGGGCPACQKKSNGIKISQPADAAEIEADQIADKVMRMPTGNTTPVASSKNSSATIQRKCSTCEDDEKIIQRKPVSPGVGVPSQSSAHVSDAVSSGGRPLDNETRNFFEPRMGRDLGNVRVHTDSNANHSAHTIDAKAYTLGNNIVFGQGQYKPDSDSGRHLIAHELAHVIQSDSATSYMHRNTIYRQPASNTEQQLRDIRMQIAILQQQLMMPINPMGYILLERLHALQAQESILLSKTSPVVRSQESLNREAVILATKQAKRREFWNSIEGFQDFWMDIMLKNSGFQKEIQELDLYWDPKEKQLIRKPIISTIEHDVMFNKEANQIYGSTLWDLLENKPVKKSRFKKVMDFICENTNPCHDNMEQFHADIDSGMSVDDARVRGLFRIGTAFIPSRGPSGPIVKGPGSMSGGPTFKPTFGRLGEPIPATPNGAPSITGVLRETVPFIPTAPFPIPGSLPKPAPEKPTATPAPKPTPEPMPKPTPTTTPTPTVAKRGPKPAPVSPPGPSAEPNADTIPIPAPTPQQPRKKEKKCNDICSTPLPISWPGIMPLPGSQRPLVRTPSKDAYISPDTRSKPQRDLQAEIHEQLDRHRSGMPGAYVPRPCFANDADPNDLYDAHHIHPLFLGGAEDEINLCALRRDKHEIAHRRLNNQNLMFTTNAIWINCKVCSPYIQKHLGQQEYDID